MRTPDASYMRSRCFLTVGGEMPERSATCAVVVQNDSGMPGIAEHVWWPAAHDNEPAAFAKR